MTATITSSDVLPQAGSELDVLDDPVEMQRFTRWTEFAGGERRGQSSFQIGGMVCAACAGLIETAVAKVDGVLDVQVSAAGHRAQITWDPARTRVSALVRAVRGAGYDAVPDAAAEARELRRKERRTALWRLFVASFCAMQVMMFATPSYVATDGSLAPDLRQLLNWGSWLVSLPALLFAAGPFFGGAWHSVQARRISMDVPVAIGLAVTFVASSGATFDPQGPFGHEVYFDSFTMFVSFLLGGRFLELTARHRAAEALEKSVSGMPETALRLGADGQTELVSVQRLRRGDVVQVALGMAFPADGRLTAGQTQVDESVLTGESRPVLKQSGDNLVGGSANVGAPVCMLVEQVGADTRYAAIVSLMRDALTQRPAWARRADRWAGPFLWAVLLLAAGAAAVWSVIDPSRAVWVAVSVLIVTCPCALSLAAPAALVAATGALARRGVMLQRMDALEALAGLKRLYLDKTGTLTEDRPMLQQVVDTLAATNAAPVPGALAAAKVLAGWSRHPLSQAVAQSDLLVDEDGASAWVWRDVNELPGQGLEAVAPDGTAWRLGSLAWVQGAGQVTSTLDSAEEHTADSGAALVTWFGPAGQPRWRFEADEQLRADAVTAVAGLKAAGLTLGLLSGDSPARAASMAQRLGLSDYLGHATPDDKRCAIAQAQARGERVGMVGDGVNDAPVLALADVSFAMGQGALVSRAHADAVVVSNRLQDVVVAVQLARRTLNVIRQNLIWAAVYNAACIPLALAGYLPPWAAGLGMALSSLLVVANAMRLAR
ncbi:heavy metal translocating P-type ATPase [Ideonella margarita]|uniref:Cation-translocating P-type ATPase n=1 Tax=Ideonella margarita TaxID=2984191 RepID=A0ABU9C314_9BURK